MRVLGPCGQREQEDTGREKKRERTDVQEMKNEAHLINSKSWP